jgi:hypothetical protein
VASYSPHNLFVKQFLDFNDGQFPQHIGIFAIKFIR